MLARPVLIDSSAYVAIKVHFYISQYLSSHMKSQNCLAFVLNQYLNPFFKLQLIKTHSCATIYLDVKCASTALSKFGWINLQVCWSTHGAQQILCASFRLDSVYVQYFSIHCPCQQLTSKIICTDIKCIPLMVWPAIRAS